jgi:hypothetical protein
MAEQNERDVPMVHIRYHGQSWRLEASALDVGQGSSDDEIKRALAQHLEVPLARLSPYVVERHANGNITVRPEAVFG